MLFLFLEISDSVVKIDRYTKKTKKGNIMINPFSYLNQTQQGLFAIACGIVMLILQALGFLQTIFGAIIIVTACYLIVYGIWLSRLHIQIKHQLEKYGVMKRKP